jgi:F0F1-type ATP synthase delta subunit
MSLKKDIAKNTSPSGVENLARQLLEQVYTTAQLKQISVTLETMTQTKSFKSRAREIAGDEVLTESIKRSQLMELIDELNNQMLSTFFREILKDNNFWLFASKQFDYFDEFVQSFQMLTESLTILHLVTAIELKEPSLIAIAKDLSQSFKTKMVIHLQIKPTIMGGAQIRLGNLVFDYSLKSKFSQFERHWISKLEKTSAMVGRE